MPTAILMNVQHAPHGVDGVTRRSRSTTAGWRLAIAGCMPGRSRFAGR